MEKEIVFIGLGRMGAAMTTHLVEQGWTVHGFDVSEAARNEAENAGVVTYSSIAQAIGGIATTPKTVWLMVPSTFVDDVLAEVVPALQAGDTIVDGGNTFFKETKRRYSELAEQQLNYIDCGVSGGMEGARYGASLMVGGDSACVTERAELFAALAMKNGWGHVGGPGAGHFVKMVHNGIEYGMMGAIAEGMAFMEAKADELQIDVCQALYPYNNGSIIDSALINWLADAYRTEGYLEQIAGEVPQGETEMEMEFIVNQNQTPVLQAALQQRKATRTEASRTGTLISAMRNQFGGHKTLNKNGMGEDATE